VVSILSRVEDRMPWSFIGGIAFSVYSFLYGMDNNISMLSLLILIIFDFSSAIAAAYTSGEEIKSAKVLRTAVKIVVYFGLIAAAHMAESGLPLLAGILDESTIGFLVATELISIMENAGKMGFKTPNIILNKLKEFTERKQ
jgi:toxin secretion/phage lysis holin